MLNFFTAWKYIDFLKYCTVIRLMAYGIIMVQIFMCFHTKTDLYKFVQTKD